MVWAEIVKSFLWLAFELTLLFVGISFLVNLLQGMIPYEKMEKWMKETHPVISSLIAVLFAFVTPFCSCSTIPVIVNLLKQKVRFGVVMVFLFASPVLDPTILTIMTVLLGIKVTIAYTVITAVLSIVIGISLEKLGFESQVKQVIMKGYQASTKKYDIKLAFKETLALMKTVYPYLLIGAAIGAVIKGVVPTEWISMYMGNEQWWLIPLAAIIGVPLYIRLSTMIPISHILIVKGMALGPVMALMISSAGASLPEIAMLNSIFKKKLVATFMASVFFMATVSGFLFYFI